MTASPRGWVDLSVPAEWEPQGEGVWSTPHRGRIEAYDILDARTEIAPEIAVEAHEAWCEAHHLNAQQLRMEQLPNGLCLLRSFGETRSDEFVMATHLWHGHRLSLLVFRVALERLSDDDLADVLHAILEAKPLEGRSP